MFFLPLYSKANNNNNTVGLEAATLTITDHYPACEERKVLAEFTIGSELEASSWFSDTGKIGIKYSGSSPLPEDFNLPFLVAAYYKGE